MRGETASHSCPQEQTTNHNNQRLKPKGQVIVFSGARITAFLLPLQPKTCVRGKI